MQYKPLNLQSLCSGPGGTAILQLLGNEVRIRQPKKRPKPNGRWPAGEPSPRECRWHHWATLSPLDKTGWIAVAANIQGNTREDALFTYSGMQAFMLVNAWNKRVLGSYSDTPPTPALLPYLVGTGIAYRNDIPTQIEFLWSNTGFTGILGIMLWVTGYHFQTVPTDQPPFPKKKFKIYAFTTDTAHAEIPAGFRFQTQYGPPIPGLQIWFKSRAFGILGLPAQYEAMAGSFTPGQITSP